MAADAPTPGLATASTAAADAAAASTSVPVGPSSVPDVPTPSSQPAAEEELEVVSGRGLLQGPPEEDAVPLPRVLVRVRRTIEEATSTTEAAFRREWAALESEHQRLGDWHIRLEERMKAEASRAAAAGPSLRPTLSPTGKGSGRCSTRSSRRRDGRKPWRCGRRLLPRRRPASRPSDPSSSLAARDSRSASWSSTSSPSLCTNGARSCRRPPACRPLPR